MNLGIRILIELVMKDLGPVLGKIEVGVVVFVMATDAAVVSIKILT